MSFYFDDDDDENFANKSRRGGSRGGGDGRGFSLLSQASQVSQVSQPPLPRLSGGGIQTTTAATEILLPSSSLSSQQQPSRRQKRLESVDATPSYQRRLHFGEENKSQNQTDHHHHHDDDNYDDDGVVDDDYNDDNDGDFVCDNCGSGNSYIDDVTGVLTCSNCYTQSQAMLAASQEEFDYEEAVGMANKQSNGQLRRTHYRPSGGGKIMADGTMRPKGRALIPLSERDKTVPPPPLEECLMGLQTVLQLGCRILCYELMPSDPSIILVTHPNNNNVHRDGENMVASDEQPNATKTTSSRLSPEQLYKEVSRTVKILWKTYLEAWMDGAQYYGTIYPEFRFSFRDYFLAISARTLLHQTLAARAAKELREQVENDPNVVDNTSKDKRNHGKDNENDVEDDDEEDDDDASTGSEETLPDVIRLDRTGGSRDDDRSVDSDGDHHHHNNDGDENNDDGTDDEGGSKDSVVPSDRRTSVDRIGDDDGDASVSSELSVLTAKLSDNKNKSKSVDLYHIPRLLLLHQKRIQKLNKSKSKRKQSLGNVGRREAALLLTPSLTTAIGMLWMAVAPYGVTAGKIIDWVSAGALPLLNSFSTLFSAEQQTLLKGVSSFFRNHIPPTTGQLTRVVKCLHLTSGYEPPQIRVSTRRKSEDRMMNKGTLLLSDPLNKPGRVIRPSGVPIILASLIIELGLGQRVLNYCLAMMGLPVAQETLFDSEEQLPRKMSRKAQSPHVASSELQHQRRTPYSLPQQLAAARPDRLSILSKIIAVIVVACKLIPDWDEKYGYHRLTTTTPVLEGNGIDTTTHSQRESLKRIRAARRFIPWNEQHFRFLGNGRLEEDYLDYLEENVMKINSPVLPKFVSMLKIPDASIAKDNRNMENSVVINEGNVASDAENKNDNTVMSNKNDDNNNEGGVVFQEENAIPVLHVTPNVNYLSFKATKKTTERKRKKPNAPRSEKNSFEYVLTSPYCLENSRSLDPPLAALIEYMAYKTGTIPELILDYLVEIDKEIGAKAASLPTLTKMTPQEAYEKFILGR
jgi:hypothetical protein